MQKNTPNMKIISLFIVVLLTIVFFAPSGISSPGVKKIDSSSDISTSSASSCNCNKPEKPQIEKTSALSSGPLTSSEIATLQQQAIAENWTFTVGENDATQYSLDQLCGLVEPKDWWVNATFDPCTPKNRSLPTNFDWRVLNGCPPIRNQGGCGSCWAFGTVGPLECNIKIKDGVTVDLSEQWLVSCNREGWGCQGGWWAHDYHQWKTDSCGGTGAVLESYFPYTATNAPCNCPYPHSYRITSWAFIGSGSGVPSTDAIKQAIMDHGPVSVAIAVNSAFSAYHGGVFNGCSNGQINHAVTLVGWDDNQGPSGVWYLRNSWGTSWGEGGYMRIPYGCCSVGYAACYVDYPSQPIKLKINVSDDAIPKVITPGDSTTITVKIEQINDTYVPGSGMLYYRFDLGTYQTSPLTSLGGNVYQATLPAGACGQIAEYYFSAQGVSSGTIYNPALAPFVMYSSLIRYLFPVVNDTFENALGWTVTNSPSLINGAWERGIPAGDGTHGDPLVDFDGSGKCYVTGNRPGDSDVDGGTTSLISPSLNLSAGIDGYISYALWYTNNIGGNPNNDVFTTSISNDNGGSWTPVETIGPQTSSGWKVHRFLVSAFVPLTNQMKVRFDVSDLDGDSTVEAGVDAFQASVVDCRKSPFIPSFPSPSDQAITVNLSADLSWVGGDQNPGVPITYDVYFGTTNPPAKVVSNQSGTMYDLGLMNLWTTYFWQIVAWYPTPDTPCTSGPIWEFRTEDPIFPEWRSQGQSSPTVQPGGSLVLSAQGRDNIALEYAYLAINESGRWVSYSGQNWWNINWNYSKRIVIDHTKIAGDLTNFPVLVSCTSSDFINHAQPDGDDFLFADATNTTQYNHEIEYYNSATGELAAWVKIPFLSSTQDTVLYMYYGNAGCGSQQNVAGTWDSNFILVDHLTGAAAANLKDSSANHWDVTSSGGNPTYNQIGKVGRCVDFDGADDYLQTNLFRLPTDSSYTASAWVYADGNAATRRYIFEGASENIGISLLVWTNETFKNYAKTDSGPTASLYSTTTVNVASPQWYYVSTRVNAVSDDLELFVNSLIERNMPITGLVNPEPNGLNIGTWRSAGGYCMNGKIDEVRISNVVRDDSWIKTEYNNMASPSTFLTMGNEVDSSGGMRYDSPRNLYGAQNLWTWSNFTWQNPGIPEGKQVWWKIYYVDSNQNKVPTDIMSFVVSSQPQNNLPYVPSVPSPGNGVSGVSINADLSWVGGDPDAGDTVTYDVFFGTSPTPPKVVSNQSGTSYDPGTLGYLTPYYWKIVSWDNHGASSVGSVWSFTTEQPPNNPPYVPSNPSPGNGLTGISINADLSWTGGDPDSGDTVTYDVYFEAGDSTPDVLVSNDQPGTSYDPGTMGYSVTYYWQIVSTDNHLSSTPGPVWSFTTEAQPIPPAPTQVTDITAWHIYPGDLYKGIGGYPAKQYTYQSTSTELGSDLYFTFSWGDGNSTVVGNVSGSASASHTYGAKYGTYSITVTVKHGSSGIESTPSPARSVRMFKLGDCNNDNKVTFADIDPFVAMLGSHLPYVDAHPDLYWFSADCNLDNSVTFADIDPFVALLGT